MATGRPNREVSNPRSLLQAQSIFCIPRGGAKDGDRSWLGMVYARLKKVLRSGLFLESNFDYVLGTAQPTYVQH